MSATPRPWTVLGRIPNDCTVRGFTAIGRSMPPVAYVAYREDAERINAAVNLHDDLLAALRLIESVYRQNCVAPGEPSSVLDAVQAVLARADASQEAQR